MLLINKIAISTIVIDLCLTKGLYTDTATNMSTLRLEWASRNNCIQRAGRAGRLMDGRVYRMVSKTFYNDMLSQSAVPEMLRSPLEHVVLKSKLLEMGAPHSILALAMDQPDLADVKNTILVLKELGGLLRTCSGRVSEHDGDLTFIGRVMSAVPLDVRVTRLILFGHCFSVLDECIIIAAGLNVKSIFQMPFNKSLHSYAKKLRWSDASGSDLFAILKAYRTWSGLHREQHLVAKSEPMWCQRNFLNMKSLKEMANLVAELTERLSRLGIVEQTGALGVHWTAAEKSVILKCVIAGAFYPNYFMRLSHDEQSYRDIFKQLNGRDPDTTVFFSGFNQKYVGPLYVSAIKDLFQPADIERELIHVSFDGQSEKIFVTFKPNHNKMAGDDLLEAMPGKVLPEVYKVLKMRKSGVQFTLRVMK